MRTVIIFLIAFIAVPCTAQWTNTNFGGNVFAFGVHDTSLFVSGVSNDGSTPYIYCLISPNHWSLSDEGIDWTQGNVTTFASLGRYFFAGQDNGPTNVSTDNGSLWTKAGVGSPIASNGRYLFGQYVSPNQIVFSRDSGKDWVSDTTLAVANYASIGSSIFANTNSGVFRSFDTGNTWTQIPPPFVGTITPMDSLLFIVSSNGAVAESLDLGSNWSTVSVDSAGVSEYVNCLATDGKNLFAGTKTGFLVSTDIGKTWLAKNDSIAYDEIYHDNLSPSTNVTQIAVFDTLVFAQVFYYRGGFGSGYYLFDRTISDLIKPDSTSSVVQVPSSGDSISIYPNPATGTVSILAGGTTILGITVLNVLGEDVLDMPSLREADISLDLSKLPAGTYFFKIQTSSGTQLRKITIER